ncbi:MAG: dihydroxyacetone kinase subunit DhaL [Candidatus Dormibacteria bacterium]
MSVTFEQARAFVSKFQEAIAADKEYLTELDSAIGDGDHGINMDRGMRAVLPKVEALPNGTVADLFRTVAMTLISTVGGASGPLYGTLFLQLGTSLKAKESVEPQDWSEALTTAVAAVMSRGRAEPRDKTMVDALLPASQALASGLEAGDEFDMALQAAEEAAHQGALDTIPMVAHRGRASYLGDRSAGHQDPGATSSWMLMRAAREAFATGSN